ncbi:MAG TPA: Wadjet anti-phage system protein JetD domain-containing protein [Rhodopila sp.]|jgi:hypothetical protein|nr:Wadjet anti-phage system protein JetD domain-containing protein [Rhodopila sp.]
MAIRFRDGLQALHAILDRAEQAPESIRLLAYPDYLSMETDEERRAFHVVAEAAEAAGGITVSRDRRQTPQDIRFLQLADRERLAAFLGRVPAPADADAAVARLKEAAGLLPSWVEALVGEIGAAWRVRREPYPGLAPGDAGSAAKFLMILSAIDRGDHLRGWDMRTFSRRACGDSKAVEAGVARLARVLRARFDLPAAEPREILAALGIEKFPQPVLIRAPLLLPDGAPVQARPYLGVPPDWASVFGLSGAVPYVLVVENLASFNRHCREIDDGGAVVFSGGFPSRAVMAAIRRLDGLLGDTVPFFHWGDADRHGHLILEHIGKGLGRALRMHLMDDAMSEQEETDPRSPLDTP